MVSIRGRALQSIVFVLVVVAAGCGGGPASDTGAATSTGDPQTTTDATTATTTETVTSTTDVEPEVYPPGFDESGYADRQRAWEGHLQALAARSFTSTTRFGNGVSIRIQGNPESGRVYKVLGRNGTVEGEFFFADGNAESRGPFYGDVSSYDRAILFDGQFELVYRANLTDPRVSTEGDRTTITYGVTGEGIDGNLTVTRDGLVVQYTASKTSGGDTGVVHYRVTGLGNTTVERPDWAGGDEERSRDGPGLSG